MPFFSKDGKSVIFTRFDSSNNPKAVVSLSPDRIVEKEILKNKVLETPDGRKGNIYPIFPLAEWISDNEILMDSWIDGIIYAAGINLSYDKKGQVYRLNLENSAISGFIEKVDCYFFTRMSPDRKRIAYSSIDEWGLHCHKIS